MSRIFCILSFLFIIIFCSGCSTQPQILLLTQIPLSTQLRVIFFDVGQGDAALIITPEGRTILVDGGPDDQVLSKIGKYLPIGQKKIDTMILTHPHADHLTGLIAVLQRYQVGEIYYSGVTHTTEDFLTWLKLIKEKSIPLYLVENQSTVEYGAGVSLDFLWPKQSLAEISSNESIEKISKSNNLNNTSVVFKLNFDRTSFLFMGDAETPVEKELLDECVGNRQACSLRADVLKVGHHGSHSSTSEEFLKAVGPEYAVISVGKNNDFGHPHLITLRRLGRKGSKIFRTDEIGDIEMVSDGENIIKK